MSRFKHLLDTPILTTTGNTVGIFPFNTLIDPKITDVHSGKIEFIESAIDGLKVLANKNYSVVLFINQFKGRQLSFEHFQSLNQAVENFIQSTGVTINGIYWCPGVDRNDPFVVPNPGMFNRVTENIGVKWKDIPVISTNDADLTAAVKVKAAAVKIGKGSSKWTQFDTFLDWVKHL